MDVYEFILVGMLAAAGFVTDTTEKRSGECALPTETLVNSLITTFII